MTSVNVMLASFIITLGCTENATGCPFAATEVMQSVMLVDGTSSETTWYSSISCRVALPCGLSSAARSIPASANAWSVGANTVNGPGPSKVESRSACNTALTRLLWIPVNDAVAGISSGGIRTWSITWMIPLED